MQVWFVTVAPKYFTLLHVFEELISYDVFWVAMPCSNAVVGYKRFRGHFCPHLHGELTST
jgi:hypothetical protein